LRWAIAAKMWAVNSSISGMSAQTNDTPDFWSPVTL
jgi:hypothetical protein